jgi:hypothetical protein
MHNPRNKKRLAFHAFPERKRDQKPFPERIFFLRFSGNFHGKWKMPFPEMIPKVVLI